MKVQHKNSQEIFDLTEPRYTKFNGMYGYLTMTKEEIFFIYNWNDELFRDTVTEQFNLI